MNCPNCHNPLPADAHMCPVCGELIDTAPPGAHAVPEGFAPDPSGSGQYYRSTMGVDPATNAPVQYVTWFDPATGAYNQVSYPQPDAPAPDAAPPPLTDTPLIPDVMDTAPVEATEPLSPGLRYNPNAPDDPAPGPAGGMPVPQFLGSDTRPAIPEGFTLDVHSGLYTKSTQGPDPQTGAPTRWVTTYDAKTDSYGQYSEPLGGAAPIPPPPPGEPGGKGGKKKIIAIVVIVLVIAALAVLTVLQGWYKLLPFFGSDADATSEPIPPGLTGSAVTPSFSPYDPDAATSGTDDPAGTSSSSSPQPAPTPPTAFGSALTDMWYDHPHVNEFYMRVQEDADHIYFHQPGDEDYMTGSWFRMNKDGSGLVRLDRFVSGTYEVSGFALLGDMLYFSVPFDELRAAYYRVPKAGGEAELLFLHEKSYMLPYKGELYMMFPEQLSFGVYKPDVDRLPRLTTLVEWDESSPADPAWLMSDFSLYDGWLYYGEQWEDACTFYRYNLLGGSKEVLLAGSELQQSFVFDTVFIGDRVIYNHYNWDDDKLYLKMTTLRGTSHETITSVQPESGFLPFFALIEDRLIYQQGAHYNSVSIDTPLNGARRLFTTYAMPYGAHTDWIFFKGEVWSYRTGETIQTGAPGNGPAIDILNARDRARELYDAYPAEWGVAG